MRVITTGGITLLAVLLSAFLCVSCSTPKPVSKGASKNVSMRLMWLNQAQFAGIYFADRAGYYKDEGLNVTLHPGGMDFPAVKMVASGADTFGIAGAEQILLARAKGIPVVAVAVIFRRSPFVLLARKDSGITKPTDFVGKKVGVKFGDSGELIYRSVLKGAGVDSSKIVEVPVKIDLAPMLSKKVDVWTGYVINEPITCEEQGQPVNLIWPDEYGVKLYGDTLFTTDDTIKKDPELVRKMVKATVHGWQDAMERPSQAIIYTLETGAKLNEMHEVKMLKAAIPLLKPDKTAIGFMEPDVWQSMQKLLLQQGFMKKPVDVNQVFTNKFLP
jgi:ABC-type nitrate/sulfonate/bicarbonate transport system substrate-binding protein